MVKVEIVLGKNLKSTVELTNENYMDFIEFVKNPYNKNIEDITGRTEDPNPIMCYSGNDRVIPGTDVVLIKNEVPIEEYIENNPSVAIIEYNIKGKKFINMTPHPITYEDKIDDYMSMVPCGIVPRLRTELKQASYSKDVIIFEKEVIINIPEPTKDVYYIVSRNIYDMLPERTDLVVPNLFRKKETSNGGKLITSFLGRV